MAGVVRYQVNGDNLVLRFVIYNLWGYKCYWCLAPKDFNNIQLDHIIPQAVKDEALQRWKAQFNLPDEFNIHDPGNLAPICAPCNGPSGKGNQDLINVPVLHDKLRRARHLRSKVIEEVRTFANTNKLAEALILATEADLSNSATKQAFEEYAPAVVQKLALLDEAKADFVSFRTVTIQVDENRYRPELKVGISLRARERRVAAILEDVCGDMIDNVIQEPVMDLIQQIGERVQRELEDVRRNSEEDDDYPVEPITAGPPVGDFNMIDIDSLGFDRTGKFFEFTFGGKFDASLSASLAQYSADGSELLELQGDAFVTGSYSFVATCNLSKGVSIEVGDCWIESWNCDTETHRWT